MRADKKAGGTNGGQSDFKQYSDMNQCFTYLECGVKKSAPELQDRKMFIGPMKNIRVAFKFPQQKKVTEMVTFVHLKEG